MANPGYPSPYPTSGANTYTGGGPQPTPPGSVKGAFLVYVIVAVLAVVGIALVLTSNVWNDAIRDSVTTSGINAQSLVNTVKIISVAFGVIFLALYLFFAFKMRAGRNWARIVLTVLSGLSILSSFSASGSVNLNGHVYKSSSAQISGWISVVLSVVAIVLMYLSASNQYFKASKAARSR